MVEHARPSGPPTLTLSQALAQKIKELLVQQRWSQREFARRLGVTQGAVSYLLAEKRRAEVLDYYERLAAIFGVSLSALIADLEQRTRGVAVSTKGAPDGASEPVTVVVSASSTATTTHTTRREDSVVFRTVLDALIDARIEAADARIGAHVEAALARLAALQQRHAAPTRKRRRRPPPSTRTDDRDTGGVAGRAVADAGAALPSGRDPVARGLRRVG